MTNPEASAPIKWHGGKSYLAAKIVSMMPRHIHYVEPFFGGGAVLFSKPTDMIEGHSEIINDVFGELITFWKVLQSNEYFAEFKRRMLMTPFAKPIWEKAHPTAGADPIEQACCFFIRYRQSRQGLGQTFATMSRTRTRRGLNEQVSAWLSAVEGLEDAHERLRRVAIFCEDASTLIRREDDNDTFFYCDPPYVTETRVMKTAYACELSDPEHVTLLQTLGALQGKFILSGYPNPMYDAAEKRYGWRRIDIQIDNKASAMKVKPKKTECLWRNF
jgi:DNA adenine methylase